jgi:hemerythrin-like domain-containing protein
MSNSLDPRTGPVDFFTADHRHCDEVWARVEAAIDGDDAKEATRLFAEFDAAMRLHLAMEEEVLFPAFEAATGMRGGPTHVMRMEHQQMRGMLDQMARAAATGDFDSVSDHGDTLMMLIQQHNLKEEGMLYPMTERALGGAAWGEVGDRLAKMYAR